MIICFFCADKEPIYNQGCNHVSDIFQSKQTELIYVNNETTCRSICLTNGASFVAVMVCATAINSYILHFFLSLEQFFSVS